MKKIILTLAHLIILTLTVNAQNSIWSLPPNYGKFNSIGLQIQPLPTQQGTNPLLTYTTMQLDNYHGQQAIYNHNAIQDANGDLLFFIVDSRIYDSEGYVLGVLNDGGFFSTSNGVIADEIVGYAETMIIPVPGNCQQYYIVSGNTAGVSSHGEMSIYYALLDMSITSLETGRKGVLLAPNTPNNGFLNVEAIFLNNTTINLSSLVPNFTTSGEHEANTSMAVTKLRGDNTRLLFLNGPAALFRFVVNSNGIFYDNSFNFPLDFNSNVPNIREVATRGEMEIVETSTGYRLAFSYPSNVSLSSNVSASTFLFAELNANGDIIPATVITKNLLADPMPSSLRADIKGVEFSPNGNFVYITHDANATNPFPFKIYDVVAQNFIPNNTIATLYPQLTTDIPNFKNSYIELSGENVTGGRMYLANTTNMATIDNVDNPLSGLAWNNSANSFPVALPYNLNTIGFQFLPIRQQVYLLPDQIDGMDYTQSFFINAVCCRDNSSYDISKEDNNNVFSGNLTWDGLTLNNPWSANSTTGVTVKDQMIIQSGANITINNMRFEFAPEAQLIIEDGAKLTINGTTLTADTRCDANAMWQGVEVWGNGTFQPATSGSFIANALNGNQSVIEHAIEATANYQHDLTSGSPVTNTAVSGFNGGIIQLTDTKLRNNVYDVYMITYQSAIPNGGNIGDRSRFTNCNFITDAALNDPSKLPLAHVRLSFVDNIRFHGCDFQNTTTGVFTPLQRGIGIRSENTRLRVTSRCNSPIIPCANLDKGNFNNLFIGVWAQSNTGVKTATITNNLFDNVFRCVILKGLDYATVLDNDMNVGANINFLKSVGLALLECDQYKVNYNKIHTSYNAFLGCYVRNSGTAANEIYKNTFTDLVIGSQAAGINGDGTSAFTGLEFRCNEYYNTSSYDILVSSGLIKAFHGSCANNTTPSNNRFSYTAQFGDFWMTNNTTPPGFNVAYRMSQDPTNSYNIVPRDYNNVNPTHYNYINTAPSFCPTVFNPTSDCPVRTTFTAIELGQKLGGFKKIVTDLKAQIDGGDTKGLMTTVASNQSVWKIRNALMDASPYLSDEVILTMLEKKPSLPNYVIQQVLSANAPLSDEIFIAAIERTPVLPNYLIKDLAIASSPLHSKEQLAIIHHTPKYPDWMLTQIMVNESPLKEEVLLALMNESPSIASWSIRNIFMKNTPLSEAVNDVFSNHFPSYPNWVVNAVNNSPFVADVAIDEFPPQSVRMELDQEIAYYKGEATKIKSDIIRILLADESTLDKTVYRDVAEFLKEDEAENTNVENQDLVNAQIADGDLSAAQQKLASIHNAENANFCKLKNTVMACQQYQEKEAVLLTNGSLRQAVNEVATATTNQLEVTSAKILLEEVGLLPSTPFVVELVTPPNANARVMNTTKETVGRGIAEVTMDIYPNPANEQFTITHDLELDNGAIVLTVYDVMGKTMVQQTIKENSELINVQSLKAGIYFYNLSQNNHTFKTEKLVIE